MGFTVYESREAETDEMNFVKLNRPGHPSRRPRYALSHGDDFAENPHLSRPIERYARYGRSSGQVYRARQGLPPRSPGRLSQSVFHQVEGLVIDQTLPSSTSKDASLDSPKVSSGPIRRYASGRAIFPSPSLRPKSTSHAPSAEVRDVRFAGAAGGWSSPGPGWFIPR